MSEHFLNPRSSVGVFKLPNGVSGCKLVTVKEMTGREEELLAAAGDVITRLNQVMLNCAVAFGEAQPTMSVIAGMTSIDRVALMLAIRRMSLGDTYDVKSKCQKCGHEGVYSIDLDGVVSESDAPLTVDVVLSNGQKVVAHALNGHDEAWQAGVLARRRAESPITVSMAARISSIDDVPVDRGPKSTLIDTVLGWSMSDRRALRRAFSAMEGGLDLSIEISCASCGNLSKGELNVGSPDFFFPSGT